MFSPKLLSLVVISTSLWSVHSQTLPVSIALKAPASAPKVDPALVSFSLEQDRWTDYAGTTSKNEFFFNSLDNLKKRTGSPPWIRIGADSEDHTNFNPSVEFAQITLPAPNAITPYPEASNVVVGDGYYQIASHLPSDTHVIWGLNFGQNNFTSAFLSAVSIAKAFKTSAMKKAKVSLDFIEIGNEADFFGGNGHRNVTWTPAEYTKEWNEYTQNLSTVLGITPTSKTKWLGGGFATSSHSTTGFSPQSIFAAGILNSDQGKLITSFSQHRYSGSFCAGNGGLLSDLMAKAAVRGNLTIFNPDIAATHALGLDYIMGETNSYACHGAPGVSNTAGAALWTLDYALFASQIGISKVFFHMGIGYKYSLIQPATLTRSPIDGSTLATPLAPHVQPQYYGAIIATEAIGTTGKAQAVELTINDDRVSGYAFYESNKLKRVVLINAQAWLIGTAGDRPSKTITLNFSGSGSVPKTMTVKRLNIQHADDTGGLTWGGQSFETTDARPSGSLAVQKANANTSVQISSTEAVLLSFN